MRIQDYGFWIYWYFPFTGDPCRWANMEYVCEEELSNSELEWASIHNGDYVLLDTDIPKKYRKMLVRARACQKAKLESASNENK